jgi:alkylation response protein AidB-like acyl-CoA dehydrogenase
MIDLIGEEHSMAQTESRDHPGREDLNEWRRSKSVNFYTSSPTLRSVLEHFTQRPVSGDLAERLTSFGATVATVIDPAAATVEASREFPRLRSYDELGNRIEDIEFHPAHVVAQDAVWESGLLALPLNESGAFETAALFFLLTHAGEAGQACPVVCTIGLRRALEHRALTAETIDRLHQIASADPKVALRGSQFLTEIQGGSDVGANLVEAHPDRTIEGAWRIDGEKWFCSVADADLFAVTARPRGAEAGTRGLTCFLVPRRLDGSKLNGFTIRRLKDKLGTRALASAEIDFTDALAWPIGELGDGFKIAVTELLNTSRWLNAVGSTGLMSRALAEAHGFALHRRAFGDPIIEFPLVRENLAIMHIETAASLASTFALTALVGRLDEGSASVDDIAVHRFLVNANKYMTSITATEVVHRAIEALGGNGTIEDFSPLPRLYRDAIVFESWEGTHNVLCDQIYRDCSRLGLLVPTFAWLRGELSLVPDRLSELRGKLIAAVDATEAKMLELFADPSLGALHFRRQITALMHEIQAVLLLELASTGDHHAQAIASVELFCQVHIAGGLDPQDDPLYAERITAVLEG